MKTRLQYIVKNEGLTNQRFATEIGISPAAVTHILSGRNNPSLEIIAKIANRYPNYSLRWLILGELPIQIINPQNEAQNDLSEAQSTSASIAEAAPVENICQALPFAEPEQVQSAGIKEEPMPLQTPVQRQQDTLSTGVAADRLIVCFPDGTFKEFSRQQ